MKKFRKRFNLQRIKTSRSYSILQIVDLLGVHKRTVTTWITEGLETNGDGKPYLIHGSRLKEFLKIRQGKHKFKCKPYEFYCLKCKAPREVWEGLIDVTIINIKKINLTGICIACGITLNRFSSPEKLSKIIKSFVVQEVHNPHLIESIDISCITHLITGDKKDGN